MYETYFANRLAELRTKKAVSAREMSLALGQNSSYINRIENRQAFPSMQAFFYICEYLEISPQDFFNTDVSNPAKINQILDQLKNLDDSQLDTVLAVTEGFRHSKPSDK
ncbi:MAG: helix-turn-helix transcriptional regulator [Eubacteriales bacterium]|nr:helix-turn-helix transcriptional regulator [Eubacteriales bacterium]